MGKLPGIATACMNASASAKFLDTNILVYAYDLSAGEKYRRAKALVDNLWQSEVACLSIQVLQEFYVVSTKKPNMSLSNPDAAEIISDLSNWKVHIPNPGDLLRAITLQQEYVVSFWDAMILWSAQQLGCDTLYTEDLNHNQVYGSVRVINPFL